VKTVNRRGQELGHSALFFSRDANGGNERRLVFHSKLLRVIQFWDVIISALSPAWRYWPSDLRALRIVAQYSVRVNPLGFSLNIWTLSFAGDKWLCVGDGSADALLDATSSTPGDMSLANSWSDTITGAFFCGRANAAPGNTPTLPTATPMHSRRLIRLSITISFPVEGFQCSPLY
jgi:hypothetical protein